MFNANGKITLKNINFINSHNDDDYDGHSVIFMRSNDDELTVTNCNFTNNHERAVSYGVAIYIGKGKLTVTNCRFENNTSPFGSVISTEVASTISNCTFINNDGYSICAKNSEIHDCTFIKNAAVSGLSNKIYNNNFTNCNHVLGTWGIEIYNNNFINNTGNLIQNDESGTQRGFIIRNNTFINNHDANIVINDLKGYTCKFIDNKYINNTLYFNVITCSFANETFINNDLDIRLKNSEISQSKFFNNTAGDTMRPLVSAE